MSRTLGWLLGVVLLVAGCWWLYSRSVARNVPGSGDVFTHNQISDPKNSSDQMDIDGNPLKQDTAAAVAPAAPTIRTPFPAASTTAVAPTAAQENTTPQAPAGVPTGDSIDRNPPAGMAFGGSGKYQWYRQGNITWRIDTRTGATCIDFATMDEWRKPIVYTNGCRKG
jgi:hypothetical protein